MQIQKVLAGACCFAVLGTLEIANAGSLIKADEQFVIMAAKADMTEAHEGQMAEAQASRTDVKELGKTLAQDHTAAYEQLTRLASKAGVSIPKGINVAHDRTIAQLTRLKGASFDRHFIEDEISAHRQAIAIFKREVAHGQDADVKAYAGKMIPILEKHLHLAEECAKPTRHG